MSAKWQGQPKRWRVRGKAPSDGLTVTLGRYDTEDEARTARDALARDATYGELTIEAIIPTTPPPEQQSPSGQGQPNSAT